MTKPSRDRHPSVRQQRLLAMRPGAGTAAVRRVRLAVGAEIEELIRVSLTSLADVQRVGGPPAVVGVPRMPGAATGAVGSLPAAEDLRRSVAAVVDLAIEGAHSDRIGLKDFGEVGESV